MRALLVGGPANGKEVEVDGPVYDVPLLMTIDFDDPIPPTIEVATYFVRKYCVSTKVPQEQRFAWLHDSTLVGDPMNFIRTEEDRRFWYSVRVWAQDERHRRIDFRFEQLNERMNDYIPLLAARDRFEDSPVFMAELADRREVCLTHVLWIIKLMSPDP